MEKFQKYYWYIIVGIIVFGVVSILVILKIEKMLEKRDFKKTYSKEKLYKKLKKRADDYGKFYYGINYYYWQKNKLNVLYQMFPVGGNINDKLVVTDTATYSIVTNKIFSSGEREAFYKMEFRVYYKVAEIRKSVINNFTHNGVGNQNNNVYQNDNNTEVVINQLKNFLNDINIESNDKIYVESFIYKLSQGKTTEKDKNKIIETLSKYTGVASNVVSIITNIAKFFI
ncbi:hypothetical protein [Pseudolactococcus reticulitermitis]|uniref:Uncharacterized protein n=1 Tax=Pseudolactococcus reticulitermitis TaxID=2025039 RepID=A0A224XB88_9LACT|nr:hypothetical protein [Lactococcus reticulitermitis]GAX46923.1 hypothetical protein RsY01_503 [Lactococcus reticulitermitis]